MNKDIRTRFEAKVIFGHGDDCWLWRGGKTGRTDRYKRGSIRLDSGRSAIAARVSWAIYRGEIPAGLCVLHRCDNPLCVNPSHLFLGTHADNMADMKNKGRSTSGERSSRAKLTAEMVAAIRLSHEPNAVVATEYGVARSTISHIRRGDNWKHIDIRKEESNVSG